MEETITLYTSADCPKCNEAKNWLNNSNKTFKIVDISDNIKDAQYLVEKTGKMLVPIIIKETILTGFSPKLYYDNL